MKHTAHRRARTHWRLGAAAFVVALVSIAVPASAAAPNNDVFGGATVVPSVPFHQTEDTTQATTDATDAEANADCGAPATVASVWFSYTPSTSMATLVDVSASSYSAGVIVVTGAPGSFSTVACGPGAIAFSANAGTTYHVLAFGDTPGSSGGQLDLTIKKAPPPPTVSVTVDATGTVANGRATVTGTVTCTGKARFGPELSVKVKQSVGRLIIYGRRFLDASPCNGTKPWSTVVKGTYGRFGGGKATVHVLANACGFVECVSARATRTIKLHP